MSRKVRVLIMGLKPAIFSALGIVACLILLGVIISVKSNKDIPTVNQRQQNDQYTLFAMNDLGMHCYQQDYASFLILPPANTLKIQVFKKGTESAQLVTSGIEISYEIIDNTTSADNTNFWDYAKDYGYNVPPNIGITGNGLKGKFTLSADGKYYEATAIPLTPYNDNSTVSNPYQMAHITVTDAKTGKVLADISDVVAPVSDEMLCNVCHGDVDTDLRILKAHDKLSGTHLVQDLSNGNRYKCSECHKDVVLGEPGKTDVKPLSQAMHGFHADKMAQSTIEPKCNTCHPGPDTRCYRGAMYLAGINCDDPRCHGDMANIALSQANGREAWFNEPDCGTCHGVKYAVNPNTLYRNSYLLNSPDDGMNNLILCESCHNSPHAEWKSSLDKDNLLPVRLLGYPSYIDKCTVCHQGSGTFHRSMN